MILKLLKDNVLSLFIAGTDLLQILLDQFVKDHHINKQEINLALEKCLPVLLHRTGDSNGRLRQHAHDFIIQMSDYSEIKHLHAVPTHCVTPFRLDIAPRLGLSRVEIVESLIKRLGLEDNGLSVDNITKFCVNSLGHTSGEVRELSTKILIQMYKEDKKTVRRNLPIPNEINRKNKKYRRLYETFDLLDGNIPASSGEKYNRDISNLASARQSYSGGVDSRQQTARNVKTPRSLPQINTSSRTKTPQRDLLTSPNRTYLVNRSQLQQTSSPRSATPHRSTTSITPIRQNRSGKVVRTSMNLTCTYCGEMSDDFLKMGFLNHYREKCPFLKSCNECHQIIEICQQTNHLLSECKFRNNYVECSQCNEAVDVTNKQEYQSHLKFKLCLPSKEGCVRCPLCHHNLPSENKELKSVWKNHLNTKNECAKNYRLKNDQELETIIYFPYSVDVRMKNK
jgi:hypothetical protein